ncbi:MAG: hypothetical protein ACYDHH_21950 [Solirubrobacteraceae bacterium]
MHPVDAAEDVLACDLLRQLAVACRQRVDQAAVLADADVLEIDAVVYAPR